MVSFISFFKPKLHLIIARQKPTQVDIRHFKNNTFCTLHCEDMLDMQIEYLVLTHFNFPQMYTCYCDISRFVCCKLLRTCSVLPFPVLSTILLQAPLSVMFRKALLLAATKDGS